MENEEKVRQSFNQQHILKHVTAVGDSIVSSELYPG